MASSSKKSAAKANLLGKREPQDDLEIKPILRKHRGTSEKETTEGFADSIQRVEFLETKSDQPNLISVKETVEGRDETPEFAEEVVRKKTLFVANLSPQTTISDIIHFFENVVRVQLVVDKKNKHRRCGFVEFASANEAKKALQNKNGEYLHDSKIFLDVAFMGAAYFPPKFCVDHKVWAEDYHRQKSLPIGEDVMFPDFVEDFSLREKTVFVSNLSPQTKIPDIIDFFTTYGDVVSVRLIVNHEGKNVGYGFVEFPSPTVAKTCLRIKNGKYLNDHMVFLALATTFPYTPRPKFNLAEMLWYEDCLRREILPIEEDETPHDFVEEVAVRNKSLFVGNFSPQTEISHIINFFKDVGEVVHVRLTVDGQGKLVGYGFVEFASTNEAKKALEKKNGEYLHDRKIFLDVDKIDPYRPGPKYVDFLRRESLLIEEDETMEGLVEVVARRKKTVFVNKLAHGTKTSDIINLFKDVGEVVDVEYGYDCKDMPVGYGFVEFASTTEAKKALEKKNGEYLNGRKIYLDVDKRDPYPGSKCCIDHKVWYEDYLQQESLLIKEDEEDETMEGLVEEVAERKKTLFVSKLARKTRIQDITKFFKDVAEVFRVRLIVNHMGEHVCCGFVEFASINEAKKAMQKRNGRVLCGRRICLDMAEIAPYPLRPKYNRAEKLWYEDYLRQESCLMVDDDLETKPSLEKQKEKVLGIFCGKNSDDV